MKGLYRAIGIGVLSLPLMFSGCKKQQSGYVAKSGSSGFGNPVVAVGELTGDNKKDIVYSNQKGVYLLENLGENKFSQPIKIAEAKSSGFGNSTISVGDVTGDDLEDIVIGSQAGIFVLKNLGNKQFEDLK